MPCSWSTMPQYKCKRIYHFARTCQISGGQKKQTNTLNDCDSDAVTMFMVQSKLIDSGDLDRVETVNVGNAKEAPSV